MKFFRLPRTPIVYLGALIAAGAWHLRPEPPPPYQPKTAVVSGQIVRLLEPKSVPIAPGMVQKTQQMLVKAADGKLWDILACVENCGSPSSRAAHLVKPGAAVRVSGLKRKLSALRATKIEVFL